MSQIPTLAFCSANRMRSSAVRSASTARFRSVMSLPELNVPTTRPASSRNTVFRHSINRSPPDLVRTAVSTMAPSPSSTSWKRFLSATRFRCRQAGVEEVAPEQFALGPAQQIAALAVDQGDSPFDVEIRAG